MAFQLFLAAALSGTPVADLQGEWAVVGGEVREPGKDMWRGFPGYDAIWRVQGTRIEVSYTDRKAIKHLRADPDVWPVGGPSGVRYVDYDGLVFTGNYTIKDGVAVLDLRAPAPIPGLVNTNGTKYLIIKLARPKPPPPIPGFRPTAPPRIDP